MTDEYRFERISEDNLSDFANLAHSVSGVEPDLEDAKLHFDTGVWGAEYIGYLAYDKKGEAAAYYGVNPLLVEYNGKTILAAQSGSTMTHANHRKKGLFFNLAKAAYKLAEDEGIHFVFGFPNQFSYPGLRKLEWSFNGNIRSYHFLVPTVPLGHLGSKFSSLESSGRKLFEKVLLARRIEDAAFPSSVLEENVGGIVRDEHYVKSKKKDFHFMLDIGGDTVWVNYVQGSLGIGDIKFNSDKPNVKKIIRRLKTLCAKCGIAHIRTYTSPDSLLDRLLTESGYKARQGLPNGYINFNSPFPVENFKYVYADFDTF